MLCTCLLLSLGTSIALCTAVSSGVPSSTARFCCSTLPMSVMPDESVLLQCHLLASPPLVPPNAESSAARALLFGCPILGAPLWHLEWLRRHSVSGSSHSWGQAACLVKSCFNSIPERSWRAAWWVGVKCRLLSTAKQFSFCLRCGQEWGVCYPAPSASSHLLKGITVTEDWIWLNLELEGDKDKKTPATPCL